MKTIHVYHVTVKENLEAYFVTDDRHVRFLSPFLSTSEGDHESVRRLIAEKIGDDYIYGVSLYPLTVTEGAKRLAQTIVKVKIAGKDNSGTRDLLFAHQCPFCLNEFDTTGSRYPSDANVPEDIRMDTAAAEDVCSHFYDLGSESSTVVYRGKAGELVSDEIPPAGVCCPCCDKTFSSPDDHDIEKCEREQEPTRAFVPRPDLVPDIEKKKAVCESDLTDARLSLVTFDNDNRYSDLMTVPDFGAGRRSALVVERRILRDMIKAYERQIEVYKTAIAHNKEADHA